MNNYCDICTPCSHTHCIVCAQRLDRSSTRSRCHSPAMCCWRRSRLSLLVLISRCPSTPSSVRERQVLHRFCDAQRLALREQTGCTSSTGLDSRKIILPTSPHAICRSQARPIRRGRSDDGGDKTADELIAQDKPTNGGARLGELVRSGINDVQRAQKKKKTWDLNVCPGHWHLPRRRQDLDGCWLSR